MAAVGAAMPKPRPHKPARRRKAGLELQAALWLEVDGQSLGGPDRMALLGAVARQGSITQGAQAVGVSYKTAWDAIDGMNEAAGTPLVERSTGGAAAAARASPNTGSGWWRASRSSAPFTDASSNCSPPTAWISTGPFRCCKS